MRQLRENQQSLVPIWGPHQHTRELQMVSAILDDHAEIAQWVHRDLVGERDASRGRCGLSGDQVLRIALLKQIHGLSYRELEFHLQDSDAFRAFVGLGFEERPSFQTLQSNVRRTRPPTWEAIHRVLITSARDEGIDRGEVIRTDTTVVESNIHEPADSDLLWDCVRVMTRLLKRIAKQEPRLGRAFPNRTRRARRRAYLLRFDRRRIDVEWTYRDLIHVTEEVREAAAGVLGKAKRSPALAELRDLLPRVAQVIDQARRRVLEGEKVPSEEKIVSIFEPHTDIIVKGSRDVSYGHKVCLTGGKSSLVLDCVIEEGNPADSTLGEESPYRVPLVRAVREGPPPGGDGRRLRHQGEPADRPGSGCRGHGVPPQGGSRSR